MCIIALQTIGSIIPDDYIENMWNNNPDMAGYAFIKNGKLIIEKFDSLIEFQDSYWADYQLYKDETPFLLHFRIRTHGAVSLDNCHPFQVHPNLVFAHNGVIDIKIPKKFDEFSDTWYFNRSILQQLPKNFYRNAAQLELIRNYIIGGNKLCFLDSQGKYVIVNEHLGEWLDGVWYSNDTYMDAHSWFYNYGGSYSGYDFGYSSKYATKSTDADKWYPTASDPTIAPVPPSGAKTMDSGFWASLYDSEAEESGYKGKTSGPYIHMKWCQYMYNTPQVILSQEQYQKVIDYISMTKDQFSEVYLDNELLAEALSVNPADIESGEDFISDPDVVFYSQLTKADEETIANFAAATGLDFDEVYDDITLVKRVLGPGFADVVVEAVEHDKVAS